MGVLKYAKKYAKKGTKAIGKRYGISYGRRGVRMQKGSLDKVVKDVQMIKSRLNVEKKFIEGAITSGSVGQVDYNTSGWFWSEITPLLVQGTSENERVGGSAKLTGLHCQLQFVGQAGCFTKRRLKVCIVSSTETGVSNIIGDIWDVNPLTGLVDYFSNYNYSNQKRAHKVLMTKYFTLAGSEFPPQTGSPAYYSNGVLKLNMKMQQILRFEGTSPFPKDQHYFLFVFCDLGNRSSTTDSTNSGAMVTNNLSGVDIQEYFRWWYVDN